MTMAKSKMRKVTVNRRNWKEHVNRKITKTRMQTHLPPLVRTDKLYYIFIVSTSYHWTLCALRYHRKITSKTKAHYYLTTLSTALDTDWQQWRVVVLDFLVTLLVNAAYSSKLKIASVVAIVRNAGQVNKTWWSNKLSFNTAWARVYSH